MRSAGLELDHGAFGENLVVEGRAVEELGIGSELQVGLGVVLVVTQIRKGLPHALRDLPRRGALHHAGAGAVSGNHRGRERPGRRRGPSRDWCRVPRSVIEVALVTVSDRAWRGERDDLSGRALRACVERDLGGHVAAQLVVPDELAVITQALQDLAARKGTDLGHHRRDGLRPARRDPRRRQGGP